MTNLHHNFAQHAALPTTQRSYSDELTVMSLHPGFIQKIVCGFPNVSRKKITYFQNFWRWFYLHIYQRNTLKSTFHDKISQTSGGAGSRDGSISSLTTSISIWYRNFDYRMSAIYNKSNVTNTWRSINQCNEKLYFPGQPHSFQGFFQTFPYLWSFSKLFKAWKISILNSMTFQTYPGCVRTVFTLHISCR